MSIKIKVGSDDIQTPERTKATMQARQTLDGNVLVLDHEDIDIILMPEQGKILTLPKDMMEDKVYESQDRLFKYLMKKGAVKPESIHAGNVYGSMEAIIPASDDVKSFDMVLILVARWLEDEKSYYMYREGMEDEREDELTDPDQEDSTELGEIPHASQRLNRGSIMQQARSAQKPFQFGP